MGKSALRLIVGDEIRPQYGIGFFRVLQRILIESIVPCCLAAVILFSPPFEEQERQRKDSMRTPSPVRFTTWPR